MISSSRSKAAPISRASPDSRDPELGAHLGCLRRRRARRARPRSGREIATAAAGARCACSATAAGHLVVPLVDVGDVEHRLGGQREEPSRGLGGGVRHRHVAHRRRPRRARRPPRSSHSCSATASLSPRARLLVDPLEPPLGLLEVGGEQLGLDQARCRRTGSTRPSGWGTPSLVVAADHVADRVGLADRGQELVAEPLALRRAGDQPGDVVELDRLGDDLARADRSRDLLQPLVGDADDRDVRLDRRERVVARSRRRRG